LKLGRTRLAALEAPEILRLLKGGAVDPTLVVLCMSGAPEAVEQLFREATPDGVRVWFWRAALELRKLDAMRTKTWVNVRKAGRLDRSTTRPPETDRVHRLRLERIVHGDRAALGCTITLFGGVFDVVTQLSPLMAPASLAGIEAEEDARLPPARY
jgi:hypothetical protein